MGDVDMPPSEGNDAYKVTRWLCTELMEAEVAAKVAEEEPERFLHSIVALEDALKAAKVSSNFAAVHAKYSSLLTFFSARCELRAADLRRCCYAILNIIYAVTGDISSQARHGKKLQLDIEWRPLYEILASYLDGEANGYNGAIPIAVHQAVICRLAQKARRHFSADAPAEIWALLRPKIQCVDTMDCFEGVGMLHLLMPCMRVGSRSHPWAAWMDEWVVMSTWMPTNRFWLAAWHGIFAQLSKHDTCQPGVPSVIDWDTHAQHVWTVSLWFLEVPVGGSEGACPFGRRSPSRAAYLFSRSAADGEQRMRFVTKLLVYRLGGGGGAEAEGGAGGDGAGGGAGVGAVGGCGTMETIEALVDVVENYAHPSNFGRWTQVLALFLQGLIKYMRKRVGSKQHARLPDAVTDKFAACVMRLVDKGMYSKNSVMRHVASSAAGQLAYIRPAHVLPFVMGRFMEAVEHSTATHQLNAALSVLTSCLRPMLLAPQEAFEGAMCPPPAEYLAATLDATLPGIDANDPSKTLGTIRLYAALVSNLSCLADPGQSGACEAFPFMWSEWTDALLQRFFAFFQNVDASKVTQADGSDKHRGGAGGDGGASYLMGATSMYSPLMRLIFARMHPSMRLRAVKKIAQFCLTSTHSGLTGEVGQMVMAAVTQAPEEAVPHLTRPLLDALAAEVEDVCRLVADNKDGILSADKIVSPTKEAKLKWLTGLLGTGMHYGGPRVVALSTDIRAVVRKLFELCDAAKSLRLGEMGAHVVGLYKSNPLDP